jgi:hypothetical protein
MSAMEAWSPSLPAALSLSARSSTCRPPSMLISPSTMPVPSPCLDPIRLGHFGPNSMVKSGHDDRVCVTRRWRTESRANPSL